MTDAVIPLDLFNSLVSFANPLLLPLSIESMLSLPLFFAACGARACGDFLALLFDGFDV
jgi:hypothetical protein